MGSWSQDEPSGFNEENIKGIDGPRVRKLVLRLLGRGESPDGVTPHVVVNIYMDTRERYVVTAIITSGDEYPDWCAIRTSKFREVLEFLASHGVPAEQALRAAKRIPFVSRAATIAQMAKAAS